MANALYDPGRNRFLRAQTDWVNATVRCYLVTSGYTPNLATHQFLTSIGVATRVAFVALANKTADGTGVADADDATFTAVTGSQAAYLALLQFVTGDADSPLLALIDTATGLPVTPNGGDIVVRWSDGPNKIFKL